MIQINIVYKRAIILKVILIRKSFILTNINDFAFFQKVVQENNTLFPQNSEYSHPRTKQ